MKHIIFPCFSSLVCLAFPVWVSAQDLSHLIPAAHYTLINTAEDALGLQEDIYLKDVPFSGSDGVYSNGLYHGDFQEGSLVQTPVLDALYDSIFAIRLEFRISVLDNKTRAILVCGGSYRYIGFMVTYDNTFQILYNNSNYVDITTIYPNEDQWYELTILHDEQTSLTRFYMDGTWIAEINEPFERPEGDGQMFNLHPGTGQTFLGYWRNLKLFGSEIISGIEGNTSTTSPLVAFPNPVTTTLSVKYPGISPAYWTVHALNGIEVMKGVSTGDNHSIDFSTLDPGLFLLNLFDQKNRPLYQHTIVKVH